MKNSLFRCFVLGLATLIYSCNNNTPADQPTQAGKIVINFEHFVNDEKLVLDDMKYTNTAGNQYEVTEIQWFISDLTLNKKDGNKVVLGGEKFAHYIDTDLPETFNWELTEDIPVGDYQSISMTFGIKGEKNKPYTFTDPPESDMLWPVNLGGDQGGYHYMKMNGFWKDNKGQRTPFNFHLGVGQERNAENEIIGFVQNWFEVELSDSSFSLGADEYKSINIRMNVGKWWDTPNIYNHDVHGGKIMQNQEAMKMGVENGRNAFSISAIGDVVDDM